MCYSGLLLPGGKCQNPPLMGNAHSGGTVQCSAFGSPLSTGDNLLDHHSTRVRVLFSGSAVFSGTLTKRVHPLIRKNHRYPLLVQAVAHSELALQLSFLQSGPYQQIGR